LSDAIGRQLLATTGQRNVHSARNAETMALRTVQVLRETLQRSRHTTSVPSARPEALQASAVERA
jgi:hypothetical protein